MQEDKYRDEVGESDIGEIVRNFEAEIRKDRIRKGKR
jgi:hypothetical protein